jgi:hypothetical protein
MDHKPPIDPRVPEEMPVIDTSPLAQMQAIAKRDRRPRRSTGAATAGGGFFIVLVIIFVVRILLRIAANN